MQERQAECPQHVSTFNEAAVEPSEPTVAPAGGSQQALQPTVCPGPGLPLIPRRVAEQIKRNEYVDFAELPPAKGKGKRPAHGLEGQVVVVQAADLVRLRRIISDLATWLQCYAIYAAVKGTLHPANIQELMAYQAVIARASRKFKWPSWIVYDQNFGQEAAGNPSQSWVKVEPSLYAQCFTGQEVQGEGWCTTCQGVDHSTADCPFQPWKRPQLAAAHHHGGPRRAKYAKSLIGSGVIARMAGSASLPMFAMYVKALTQCHDAGASQGQPRCRGKAEHLPRNRTLIIEHSKA